MKKPITLIVSTIVSTAMFAQEQPVIMDDTLLKQIVFTMLRPRFINLYHDVDPDGNPLSRPTAESLAKENNISHEQMTRVLETIVRENLSAINNGKGSANNVFPFIKAMQMFHGSNTVALLKECMATPVEPKHDRIFQTAVETYLVIEGAESISILREIITERNIKRKSQQIIIIANEDELKTFKNELGIKEPQEQPKSANDKTLEDEAEVEPPPDKKETEQPGETPPEQTE